MMACDLHYQENGLLGVTDAGRYVAPLWNNSRVRRLCALTKCNQWELAQAFLIPRRAFQAAYEKDEWPSHMALLFHQHEADMVRRATGAVQFVFPPGVFTDNPATDCPTCGGSLIVKESNA